MKSVVVVVVSSKSFMHIRLKNSLANRWLYFEANI